MEGAVAAQAPGARRVRHRLRGLGLLDWLFLALVVVTVAIYLVRSHGLVFTADNWRMATRGQTLGDYFQPYNDSLSIVPIAINRLLFFGWGLHTYLPFRVAGVTSEALVAISLYLTVRSRVAPALALVVGATFLWYPGLDPNPNAYNHWLGVVAVVFCAWALTRTERSFDVPIAVALALAFASSGVGASGAVGGVVFLVLTRANVRRWAAVVVPTVAWALWWAAVVPHGATPWARTFTGKLQFVGEGVFNSFRGLVGWNRPLAVILVLLFLVNLVWQLRAGLRAASHQLAWTAALVAWWAGLAYSRGVFASADAFRYTLSGSVFVVLGFLPAVRVVAPKWLTGPPAAAVGVAVALLVVAANAGGVNDRFDEAARRADKVRINMLVANLGPDVVGDDVPVPLGGYASLPAGDFRALVARYGAPPGTRPEHPDAALVDLARVGLATAPPDTGQACRLLDAPTEVAPDATVVVRAPDGAVDVEVRRFADEWISLGRLKKGGAAKLKLPALLAGRPWELQATGGCLVGG